jgi:ABC-2 type transport system permease protein
MMLLHLIKKDLLLAKTLILLTIAILIAIPLFFAFAATDSMGLLPFLYMVVLTEIMLLQGISAMEAKNPQASALLCAAPYSRKTLVQAKYAFFVLLFASCYIIYTVLSLIMYPSDMLDPASVLTVLLFSAIIYGVYMPIEFKYGNVKARFIFLALLFVLSLGPMFFVNFLADIDFGAMTANIAAIPNIVKCMVLALLSALAFMASITISIRIVAKKEL